MSCERFRPAAFFAKQNMLVAVLALAANLDGLLFALILALVEPWSSIKQK
jgi:hypothetical protein